jgi:sugar phosphate isomerase/epimerase
LPSAPTFSISQITTVRESFDDDVGAYAAAGADGLGIWEMKLAEGRDEEARSALRESGLAVTNCVPAVPSILPLVHMDGPAEPAERVEAYCASIRRLAAFEPASLVLLTGPTWEREPAEARAVVVEALRVIAEEADRAGVRVGLEPMQSAGGEDWTIVTSIPEAVELLEEAGTPQVGICFDVCHLWNTPTLLDDIERHADRFSCVHVCDCREPVGVWSDRVLPGDGIVDVPQILGAIEDSGWTGPYDLEIFSDDLWQVPGDELARRGKEAFTAAWEARA